MDGTKLNCTKIENQKFVQNSNPKSNVFIYILLPLRFLKFLTDLFHAL